MTMEVYVNDRTILPISQIKIEIEKTKVVEQQLSELKTLEHIDIMYMRNKLKNKIKNLEMIVNAIDNVVIDNQRYFLQLKPNYMTYTRINGIKTEIHNSSKYNTRLELIEAINNIFEYDEKKFHFKL